VIDILTCEYCGKQFKRQHRNIIKCNHTYCSIECVGKARMVDGAKWRDPEQIKQYMSDYQKKHRKRLNKKAMTRDKKNLEQYHARQKRYRDSHKEYLKVDNERRRAAKSVNPISVEDWEEIKKRYDYRCAKCRKEEPTIKLEIDHVMAVSNGGTHEYLNIQPLCRSCNASKGNKDVMYRLL